MKKTGILLSVLLIFCLCFTASAQTDGLVCSVEDAAREATGMGSAMPSIVLSSKFDGVGGIVIKGQTEQMDWVDSVLSLPISGEDLLSCDSISFYMMFLRKNEFSAKFSIELSTATETFSQRDITSDSDDIVTINISRFKNNDGFSIKKSQLKKVESLTLRFYGINRAPAPINVAVAMSDIYAVKDGKNYLPIKAEKEEKPEKDPVLSDDKIEIPDVVEYIAGAVFLAGCIIAAYVIIKKRAKG